MYQTFDFKRGLLPVGTNRTFFTVVPGAVVVVVVVVSGGAVAVAGALVLVADLVICRYRLKKIDVVS